MSKYSKDQLRFHHSRCHRNREDIQSSQTAGCFHCLEIFPASEVTAYIDAPPSGDAHCPRCGMDSVIADDGLNEFSSELLKALHLYSFRSITDPWPSLTSKASEEEIREMTELFEQRLREL